MARFPAESPLPAKHTIISTVGYTSTILGHLLAEVVPLLQLGTFSSKCKR